MRRHIRNSFTHTEPRPEGDITRSLFGHALVAHLADISCSINQSINQKLYSTSNLLIAKLLITPKKNKTIK